MFDVSIYNVTKRGICLSEKESLPIGNGDLGANVWIDKDGAVNLLLSKSDTFSEATQLLKLGRLRITFDQPLFSEENPPESLLDLRDGTVTITDKAQKVAIKIAVFRGKSLYAVRLNAKEPMVMKAEPIVWRDKERVLVPDPTSAYWECPFVIKESADVLEDGDTWYHHNAWSYADYTRKNQHLSELKDYIKNRTFGASLALTEGKLQSTLYISAGCEIVKDPKALTDKLRLEAKNAARDDRFEEYIEQNRVYWTDYFRNYYIHAYGTAEAESVSRLYTYQKYMSGCVNRGKMPIKFNGSIFTLAGDPKQETDYDWRMWGGDYWIQNTRLIYWNMLYSGDFEGMKTFFEFCNERIPVYKENAKSRFGIDGLLMPETSTINGTYREYDYGYGQENSENYGPWNGYINNHYNGMLEISWMMIRFLKYTGENMYFERVCLPYIQEVMNFFCKAFSVRDGKLYLQPVSSLETWWDCINDTPDIAGLRVVAEELEKMGYPTVIDKENIPEIPYEIRNGKKVIAPCEKYVETIERNIETPEMYVLFPYHIYHLTEEIPQIVQDTYDEKYHKFNNGWSQDLIWAALLGRVELCKEELPKSFSSKGEEYLFDAYFGPNFDGTPDQCHGSACSLALRMMLLQDKNGAVIKCPAWPEEWKVSYRLPAEGGDIESE